MNPPSEIGEKADHYSEATCDTPETEDDVVGIRDENGLPVFDVPPGAPPITPDDVARA